MAVKPQNKPQGKPNPPASRAQVPAPTSSGKELVKANANTAVANRLSDEEIAADARAGMAGITKEDLAIPRLSILQSLSPQVNPRDAAYVEGAQVGMIIENVTNRLFDGEAGILLCLVQFSKSDLEWIPRSKGGGFVKNHGAGSDILKSATRSDTGANLLPNGNEIVPTIDYFALLINQEEESFEQCVISFSKTEMKEARRVTTVASTFQVRDSSGRMIVPALYYRTYKFTTIPKQNDKGNWFGWKSDPGPLTQDLFPESGYGVEIYRQARGFCKAVEAGMVRVKDPSQQEGGSSAATMDESAPM